MKNKKYLKLKINAYHQPFINEFRWLESSEYRNAIHKMMIEFKITTYRELWAICEAYFNHGEFGRMFEQRFMEQTYYMDIFDMLFQFLIENKISNKQLYEILRFNSYYFKYFAYFPKRPIPEVLEFENNPSYKLISQEECYHLFIRKLDWME